MTALLISCFAITMLPSSEQVNKSYKDRWYENIFTRGVRYKDINGEDIFPQVPPTLRHTSWKQGTLGRFDMMRYSVVCKATTKLNKPFRRSGENSWFFEWWRDRSREPTEHCLSVYFHVHLRPPSSCSCCICPTVASPNNSQSSLLLSSQCSVSQLFWRHLMWLSTRFLFQNFLIPVQASEV